MPARQKTKDVVSLEAANLSRGNTRLLGVREVKKRGGRTRTRCRARASGPGR